MDQGEENIEDLRLRDRLRRQARVIALKATLIGAVVTAVLVALP